MNAAAAALRVGWCPGALRPMDSGDGLIVRLKPRGGTLSPHQARGIAEAALRHGNRALDLTSRANLQIRGVTNASLPDLTRALQDLDLLDPSPEAEAVRNVIASPLGGRDPTAILDIRPAVAALETLLVSEEALHALPAKFGIVVDDGGLFGLDDVAGDIRFEARCDGADRYYAIGLGGDPIEVASCAVDDLVDAAEALMRRFIAARWADPRLRRMSDLVRAVGGAAITGPDPAGAGSWAYEAVDVARGAPLIRPWPTPRPPSPATRGRMRGPVGLTDLSKTRCALGIGVPFGRVGADQLLRLVEAAGREDVSELRLTPWRAVLIPGLDRSAAERVAAACLVAGLVTDPSDPRLGVAACPGAPGCRRGTTAVLDHAAMLAARLPPPGSDREIRLHVSGCSKGCAHRGEASLTLVGHDGAYDLVRGGTAESEPLWRGLSVEQAARRIEAWGRGEPGP